MFQFLFFFYALKPSNGCEIIQSVESVWILGWAGFIQRPQAFPVFGKLGLLHSWENSRNVQVFTGTQDEKKKKVCVAFCCTCSNKKIFLKISFLRTRMRKSQKNVEWERMKEPNGVRTEVQTAQQTNSPHSAVVGKYPFSMSSWLYTHTEYCHNAVFLPSDEQQSTSSSHPPLLNVFSCTLSNQAAVRLLPFCSRQQCCGGNSKCRSVSDVRALLMVWSPF